MDNLTHTLAGVALGEAGLKKKTGLGLLTLAIAANLPDLDAVAFLFGESLAWRRGWTHGPLGILLLPPLLATALLGFDRWQIRRGTRPPDRLPVRFGPLLLLAYIGALSHPMLDLLNTYGIRLLMPFSERWLYGDTLFIIDIWLWIMLAAGILLSRRRSRSGSARPQLPAVACLVAACTYIGLMAAGSSAAERITARAAEESGLGSVDDVVANPSPIDPLHRRMVFRIGDRYGFGHIRWTPEPHLRIEPGMLASHMNDPAVALAARSDEEIAKFLYWSRLPLASIERQPGALLVTIWDARYSDGPVDARFKQTAYLPLKPPLRITEGPERTTPGPVPPQAGNLPFP